MTEARRARSPPVGTCTKGDRGKSFGRGWNFPSGKFTNTNTTRRNRVVLATRSGWCWHDLVCQTLIQHTSIHASVSCPVHEQQAHHEPTSSLPAHYIDTFRSPPPLASPPANYQEVLVFPLSSMKEASGNNEASVVACHFLGAEYVL